MEYNPFSFSYPEDSFSFDFFQSFVMYLFGTMLGTLLKVKPLLTLKKGEVEVVKKVRTMKNAVSAIVDAIKIDLPLKGKLNVNISHINSLDNAKALMEKIKEISSDLKVKLCEDIGPVLAKNIGKGGLAACWIKA